MFQIPFIKRNLQKGPSIFFNIYAIIAGFITYFSMYGFRKPFSVGSYEGVITFFEGFEIDYKIFFVFSQVVGYTISKFLGIKVVSEASRNRRISLILGFILFSEFALLLFPLVPENFKPLCLFLNGLPLGMIWGLVFSFLEGRNNTELLAAGLSTSYIVASGAVKSVGKWVILQGVDEYWMPVITGAIFLPLLLLGLILLNQIPPPNKGDEELRTKRAPMDRNSRAKFFKLYAPGLLALTIFYMLLTAYRDIRDSFSRELFDELGYSSESLVFTTTELPIAITVLLVLASIMLIKNNRMAVTAIHGLLVIGSLLIGLMTWGLELKLVSPLAWMIGVGLGLYLGYVPFGSVIFDRIIAETKFIGTASFMIYVTDAFGYLGSVSVMFYKNFAYQDQSWLTFFMNFSYTTSLFCAAGFGFSMIYFHRKDLGKSNPEVNSR